MLSVQAMQAVVPAALAHHKLSKRRIFTHHVQAGLLYTFQVQVRQLRNCGTLSGSFGAQHVVLML